MERGYLNPLLKSFIHVYGEDESIIKDILFIIFSKMEHIEFIGLWRFKLELSRDEVSKILLWKQEITNWKERIVIEKWDFRFVFENVERLRNDYKIENSTRDFICLFLLSCFELYELKSEYYPLHKWLFNLHFKSHH